MPAPHIPYSTSTYADNYGLVLTYICEKGHLNNRKSQTQIECIDEEWKNADVQCDRKYTQYKQDNYMMSAFSIYLVVIIKESFNIF